jgi:hypothetical protein
MDAIDEIDKRILKAIYARSPSGWGFFSKRQERLKAGKKGDAGSSASPEGIGLPQYPIRFLRGKTPDS